MIELLGTLLLLLPFAGAWATYKFWSWHQFYGTRFLWGLFLTSVASTVASIPIAYIAGRRVFLGPDAPPFMHAALFLGVSLILLEGVFVYLVIRWKDLDEDMKRIRVSPQDEQEDANLPPEEQRDIDRRGV